MTHETSIHFFYPRLCLIGKDSGVKGQASVGVHENFCSQQLGGSGMFQEKTIVLT